MRGGGGGGREGGRLGLVLDISLCSSPLSPVFSSVSLVHLLSLPAHNTDTSVTYMYTGSHRGTGCIQKQTDIWTDGWRDNNQ